MTSFTKAMAVIYDRDTPWYIKKIIIDTLLEENRITVTEATELYLKYHD